MTGRDRASHVFYLHGFASSAKSTKAAYFAERLAPHGIALHAPDFNLPAFETLTITRMIDDVVRAAGALPPGPIVLIGSSMGALVATQAAPRIPAVDRLILLAPALDLAPSLRESWGEARMAEWRRAGSIETFHYGYNEPRQVHYALFEDCERYDPFTTPLDVPVLIFQGTRDTVVNPEAVQRYAGGRPGVALRLLDDDHQLISSLPAIWDETSRFMGLDVAQRNR